MGHIIATQALVNVLGANRYGTMVDELRDLVSGRFGNTPGPIDPALARAVSLRGDPPADEPLDLDKLRDGAKGLASSEEELLLLALFGAEAERLLQSIRERASGEETPGAQGLEQSREERIRAVVKIVQETGIDEITVEEGGMRVSVRRTPELPAVAALPRRSRRAPGALDEPEIPPAREGSGASRARWSGRSTRRPRQDEPPFVRGGRRRRRGPDALHPRGDEADEPGQGRDRGDRPEDPRRERRAGRVRAAAVRARADRTAARSVSDVLPRAGCEPRRDRGARDPGAARARHRGGRRLLDRRPRRAARAPRRPGRQHRAAAGGRELPARSVDRRRRGHDRLRGGASRATASSPRTPRSSRRASTTTSSSSGRPRA